MGSTMRPTIFNDRVAAALRNWHHTAKKHIKYNRGPGLQTPMSSRPTSPAHSLSPAHLYHTSPRIRKPNFEAYHTDEDETYSTSSSSSNSRHHKAELNAAASGSIHRREMEMGQLAHAQQQEANEPRSVAAGLGPTQQHEIDIEHSSKEFSFEIMSTNHT